MDFVGAWVEGNIEFRGTSFISRLHMRCFLGRDPNVGGFSAFWNKNDHNTVGDWVTIPGTRDMYIRRRRVPTAEIGPVDEPARQPGS